MAQTTSYGKWSIFKFVSSSFVLKNNPALLRHISKLCNISNYDLVQATDHCRLRAQLQYTKQVKE